MHPTSGERGTRPATAGMPFRKERVPKPDGRYIIYYSFPAGTPPPPASASTTERAGV